MHPNTVPAEARTSDALELQLQEVVSYLVWVLESELRFSLRAISPVP